MKNLKLAVIGAGHLGRIHARLAAELPGVQLVGIADPVLEARTEVAAQAGTRAFADYRELIGKIDAAIVATPTSTHHEVGMELLSHGIHLLIEKPLALSAALGEELVEMAQQMRRADQPDQLCVSSCLLPARSLCSVSVRDGFGHAGSRRPAAIVRAAADLGKCAVDPSASWPPAS